MFSAFLLGMEYPIPSTFVSEYFATLMPMTWPLIFRRAPPEFPGLIAASVWMSPLSVPFSVSISRSFADTIPVVTDCP